MCFAEHCSAEAVRSIPLSGSKKTSEEPDVFCFASSIHAARGRLTVRQRKPSLKGIAEGLQSYDVLADQRWRNLKTSLRHSVLQNAFRSTLDIADACHRLLSHSARRFYTKPHLTSDLTRWSDGEAR